MRENDSEVGICFPSPYQPSPGIKKTKTWASRRLFGLAGGDRVPDFLS